MCDGFEDFALFVPRLYVQNVVGEICGMVSVGELSLQDVVFRRCGFARGDGTVGVLGLRIVVGRFGNEVVRVLVRRVFIAAFPLVSRDTPSVW